jgi:hypothetical protein
MLEVGGKLLEVGVVNVGSRVGNVGARYEPLEVGMENVGSRGSKCWK